MSFTAPAFLWAALAILPLAAIYLLRVRPRRQTTTALFLWQTLLHSTQTSSLFQRLRHLLSLVLMVLIFIALTLAAAGLRFADPDQRDLLLVIDTSASMQTGDDGERRIDRAKRTAIDLIDAMGPNQRAAVATLDHSLRHRCHLTTSRRDLRDAITQITAGNGPCRHHLLAALGSESGPWRERYRTLLISDGVGWQNNPGIDLIAITDDERNVGFIAADLKRRQDGSAILFYQLASSHAHPVDLELELAHDHTDHIHRVIPVTVQPGINTAETFRLDEAASGRWFLSLTDTDALPADDQVWLSIPPQRPVPVAIAAEAPYFLARCVQSFADSGDLVRLADGQEADLVICHDRYVDTSRALVLQPVAGSPWCRSVGEELTTVLPEVLAPDHPLVSHLDPESIPFTGARQITIPDNAEIILRDMATGTPLLYRIRDAERQAVVVNLDPLAGEFYLSTAFPILVHDAARLLIGRVDDDLASHPVGTTVPLGDAVTAIVDPDAKPVTIVGESLTLDQLGHYHITQHKGEQRLAGVSLLNRGETLGEPATMTADLPTFTGQGPWTKLLILLALLILVLESILYHRRMAG